MRRLLPILLITCVAAQFQPTEPPDWSGLTQREDITAAGQLEGARRVLRFVQVSDAHILDDEAPYPMRQEPLDRLGGYFTSAQRPQEEYTDEVLDAMIRAINRMHGEDALDFVVNTGDNIDNQLENELMRFIDNWEGTVTTTGPVSGLACVPDGQSTSVADDSHDATDRCTHLPDAVAANNTPLERGLPWFSAFGNHDGLIQGNVPIEPSFQDVAAQHGRYFLQQHEYVGMHFAAGASCAAGVPQGAVTDDHGHGFGFAGARLCDQSVDNDGYYAFSARGVRFIVLDTVNDDFVTANSALAGRFNPQASVGYDLVGGYAEGAVDPVQFEWLMDEVEAHKDQLVVVMSHHTVNSMFSRHVEGRCEGPGGECLDDLLTLAGYKTGPDLVAALAPHPHVVAWLGGHSHQHHIEPKLVGGQGFWNVETSSLIDMPQEARVVEVWVTADGSKGFFALKRLGHDFEASRQLAAADSHHTDTGRAVDQDVILWFDIPEAVDLLPQPSLPRSLLPSLVAPTAVNGSHGAVGENLTVRIEVVDSLLRVPVDGLQVLATVERADPGAATGVAVVETGEVQAKGNGTYSFSFFVETDHIHYVRYTVQDPTGTYPDASRTASLRIAQEDEPPTSNKKSPAPAWLLGVAALAVARRKHAGSR